MPSGGEDGSSIGRRVPDVRLAGIALGTWLAALVALSLSARTAVCVVGVAAMAAGVAAATVGPAGGRRQGWGWVAVAVLLGVVCGASATAARASVREAEPLAGLARAHATVEAELVVRDDPRPVSGQRATWVVMVDARRLTVDRVGGAGSAAPATIRLAAGMVVFATDEGWRGLLPGQRVIASGRLRPPQRGDLRAAALSTSEPPRRLGRAPWLQRAAGSLRAGLQRACAPLPDRPPAARPRGWGYQPAGSRCRRRLPGDRDDAPGGGVGRQCGHPDRLCAASGTGDPGRPPADGGGVRDGSRRVRRTR
jgi:competence protein ComEC